MDNIFTQIIITALKEKIRSQEELRELKGHFARETKGKFPSNNSILAHYRQLVKLGKINENPGLVSVLRIRKIRTLSGIASIGVHTKPQPCPGKCIYCPSEQKMPKSYLSTQPAVIRSSSLGFDPYKMVRTRLKAYYLNGHPIDKCELIVMGGTWSYHNPVYQVWYLKRCFDAFNSALVNKENKQDYKEPKYYKDARKNKKILNGLLARLKKAQQSNEKAQARVVGLTLETRPDFISAKEVEWMRKLGATRVELGVQSTHDHVLDLNKRGHKIAATIRATKLFKDAGFKITYHMMPGLYGSNPKNDLAMFQEIFTNPDFQPDQIKIYPTLVLKHSKLYSIWKNGGYKPYSDKTLKKLLKEVKLICPSYVRITRLFRDIPKQTIQGGMKITNIRQIILKELNQEGKNCQCIRCREARGRSIKLSDAKLVKTIYNASVGKEIFLSFESKDKKAIFAFCRLRFANKRNKNHFIPTLREAALVRELHTYGEMIPISTKKGKIQHKGFGKRLMEEAEKLAKKKGYKKIAVISGIGVREYYRKLGYKLQNEYMVKSI